MNEFLNPTTIGAPAAAYSLGARVTAGSDFVLTSGIVATRTDGSISADLTEQAEAVWFSIGEILAAGGCSFGDLVSYTTYVVDRPDLTAELAKVMAVRDRVLNGLKATSTLIVVSRLARPEWLLEIAAVAARKSD
jgi:2-iminobutanoate/2-iminopropanoate deaminase